MLILFSCSQVQNPAKTPTMLVARFLYSFPQSLQEVPRAFYHFFRIHNSIDYSVIGHIIAAARKFL
jgi:hypothetical protein